MSAPNFKKRKAPPSHNPQDEKRRKRTEQKELRKSRRGARVGGDVIERAKEIWERVRPNASAISGAKRSKLVEELMEILRGNVLTFAPKHDGSRVVQWALKVGNKAQRVEVFEELKPSLVELMCMPFGHFVVKSCLKYLTKPQFNEVLAAIKGRVRKLLTHRTGAAVLDRIYCLYANSHQQADMVAELYAPNFVIMFPGETSASAEVTSAAEASQAAAPSLPLFHTQLARLLAKYPAKAEPVLEYLAKTIAVVMYKGALNSTLAHVALEQYLLVASPTRVAAMIEVVRESLVEMLHTAPGARAAALCLSHGSTKDRKVMVRSFKPFAARISAEEYGHLVLARALMVVDDTVLTYKSIVKELLTPTDQPGGATPPALADIILDPNVAHMFTILIAPSSPRHLSEWQLDMLALARPPADGEPDADADAHYSKKDPAVIQEQILTPLLPALFDILTPIALDAMLIPAAAALVAELLTSPLPCIAPFADARAALASAVIAGAATGPVAMDEESDDDDDNNSTAASSSSVAGLIGDYNGSRALQTLIRASSADTTDFAALLFAALADIGAWEEWACSRGSDFVVLALLETPAIADRLAPLLAPLTSRIRAASTPGAGHILKHLARGTGSESSSASGKDNAKAKKAKAKDKAKDKGKAKAKGKAKK